MLAYVLRRLLIAMPTLFVCSIIVFLVGSMTGRSYFDKKKAEPNVDQAQIRQEERAEGLHEPLPVQYLLWLSRVCFDLYLGRPEHVVDDLEEAYGEESGVLAAGARIVRRNDESAHGRYSWLVEPVEGGERSPCEVRIPGFRAFLEQSWRAGKGRHHSAWERFQRPDQAEPTLSEELFRSVRFSIYASAPLDLEASPSRHVEVSLVEGGRERTCAELTVTRGERWVDVELPIQSLAPGCELRIRADGSFYLDWFRVQECSLRFAWGKPNFGRSAKFSRDALEVLQPFMLNTLFLGLLSLLVTWAIALPLGVYCGVHRGGLLDRVFSLLAFLGMSIPNFFLGLVVLYLAGCLLNDLSLEVLDLRLFPTAGATSGTSATWWAAVLDRLHHLILPVFVIAVGTVAGLQRITRGNLVDVLRAHYVRTARAKGLPENRVIYRHALRNAINPLITIFGYQLSALLSGAALVEIIFSYPGMGKLILDAIRDQDRNLVMATVMLAGLLLVLGNLLADVLLSVADPRIRLGGERGEA